ncbi:MAG: hypothetical protein ONB24_03505 [candidate division KSB1 bacterium]|nr:hypothetical protein [candidate division KSB1 bacterium]
MHGKGSRIDLHLHSRYSRSADDWMLEKFKIQECYSDPLTVYRIAKNRGMDFVTLTDHDTINGALEIAHLPDFFISEEITAFFPQDRAKVHVLAYGINEKQHADIQKCRRNLYELISYLRSEGIVHALAHPFFRMGPPLTLDHFEQMLVLFNVFEVKNGGKQLVPDNLLDLIFQHLTPERLYQLAEKHRLEPHGAEPWRKSRIAGSDDHGGILISVPHTRVETSATPAELLANISAGRCLPIGHGGSPLAVAHGALAVTLQFAKRNKNQFDPIDNELIWKLLENVFEELTQHNRIALAAAFLGAELKTLIRWKKGRRSRSKIFKKFLKDQVVISMLKGERRFDHEQNLRFFGVVNRLINELLSEMIQSDDEGIKLRKFKKLAVLIPLLISYLVSFRTENADRPLMRKAARAFLPPELLLPRKIAVFSDHPPSSAEELEDIHDVLAKELESGFTCTYFSLHKEKAACEEQLNFKPVALLQRQFNFHLPPILETAFALSEQNCELIYVHTLGPMGVLGMLLGKLMKIPVIAGFNERYVSETTLLCRDNRLASRLIAMVYSLADEIRLLDFPSAEAEAILERSKTRISIVGESVQLGLEPAHAL